MKKSCLKWTVRHNQKCLVKSNQYGFRRGRPKAADDFADEVKSNQYGFRLSDS